MNPRRDQIVYLILAMAAIIGGVLMGRNLPSGTPPEAPTRRPDSSMPNRND